MDGRPSHFINYNEEELKNSNLQFYANAHHVNVYQPNLCYYYDEGSRGRLHQQQFPQFPDEYPVEAYVEDGVNEVHWKKENGSLSPGGKSDSDDSGTGSIIIKTGSFGSSTAWHDWEYTPNNLELLQAKKSSEKLHDYDFGWNSSAWGQEFMKRSLYGGDQEQKKQYYGINGMLLSSAEPAMLEAVHDGHRLYHVRTWTIPGKAVSPLDSSYCSPLETIGDAMFQRYKTTMDLDQSIQKTNLELEELSVKTGMPITQENGQRRYGPPLESVSAPPKGSEVFVGKLPRDCIETEIVPVFERVGKIYEIRMMMDFSGTNRGYCFVQYHTPAEAARAVKELNRFEIRRGRYIGVTKSVDNCRLFVGGIPKDKSREEIFREISRITEDVVRVISYPSIKDRSKNRGFAFVEYQSHKAAAMARRKMIPGKIQMWGTDVAVDWAEPEPDVDIEIMNKVKALYVRNLLISTSEDTLLNIFNAASNNGVEKIRKISDYAFVHFVSREVAEQVKMQYDKTQIEGAEVEVLWAKPVDKKTYLAQKALSRSLYPSSGVGFSKNYPNQSLYYNTNNAFISNPYSNQRMVQYPGYPMGNNFCLPNGVGPMQPFSQNSRLFQYPGYQNFSQVGLGDNVGMQQNGIPLMPTIVPSGSSAAPNAGFDPSVAQQFERLNFGPEFRPSRGRAAGGVQGMRFSYPNQQPLLMNPYMQKFPNQNNVTNDF